MKEYIISAPAPRIIGRVNWVGFYSLYLKEVKRFINVGVQTVAAPVITTLLFLAIFSLALGKAVQMVGGVPFIHFLAPGLIVMTMSQNAFANTSSSMVISKVQGNIVDVLMPPISPIEFVMAYALAGTTRGLLVGLVSYIGIAIFVAVPVDNIWVIFLFGFLSSMMLSLLGLVSGIWSDKFDHMAAITNFIITPFSFLSGTFYMIQQLPEPFYTIAHYNPFFYMIDSFRGGFLGFTESPASRAFMILTMVNIGLILLAWILVKRGYKLKS
ncbi:MAG: ABC transporter permease [Alphaproteobacteria bacterium]